MIKSRAVSFRDHDKIFGETSREQVNDKQFEEVLSAPRSPWQRAWTRGVGLLPAYAQHFLPRSVTSRPLKGDTPTLDLVLGYKKSNQSPILKLLLSRLDELVARASSKTR